MATKLSDLRTKFLKLIDNYNSNDLTGTNSSGEVADLCINDSLQFIYSLLKSSRLLESYGSTNLSSIADQAYMELSNIPDLDEVRSLKDTTNDITLDQISADQYFREIPDPSQVTGTPYRFCRIFNRVFLDPRPTTAINYVCEYIKTFPRLILDGDEPLLPSKYDDWIMKEARVIWAMMEDSTNVPQILINERDQAREIYTADIMSGFGRSIQAGSQMIRKRYIADPFNHINI